MSFSRIHFWYFTFPSNINDLPDDIICNIVIYPGDTTLYSKCDQASDLWQQPELASELACNLWGTVDWDMNCLVDFNAGKTQLVFDWSSKNCVIDVKMDVCSWGKIIFLDAGVDCLSQVGLGLLHYISLLLILPLRKLEPWFVPSSFFLLRLHCIFIDLPYSHAWIAVVMCGLVLLVATWNC